jgi:uncharacterized membrane protein YfcA
MAFAFEDEMGFPSSRKNEKHLSDLENEIDRLENAPANLETSEKLLEKINQFNAKSPRIRWLALFTSFVLAVAFFVSYNIYISKPEIVRLTIVFVEGIFNLDLIPFLFVGLAAQMVDGALGMAYGATCSTFLLGLGIPPSTASASVHVAEIFTTGASGLAHLRFGNVNKKLFRYLLIPGILGAVLGAYLLSSWIDGDVIKPFVAIYLLILGAIILKKALKPTTKKTKTKNVGWLAGFGGFMDAVGGGGWGPIVTSTLLSKGRSASYTIGSVNLAEFFIALAGAGTFLVFTGVTGWQAIIGLVIGGVIASPLAAFVVSRVKKKTLMIVVAVLIMLLSLRTFLSSNYTEVYRTLLSCLQYS